MRKFRLLLLLAMPLMLLAISIPVDAQKKGGKAPATRTQVVGNKKTSASKVKTAAQKKNAATKKDKKAENAMKDTTDAVVEIITSEGPIKVLLYGDTPAHRDNFLKHVREGYYDGVLFHRVIKDFMVQAGDPNSKNAAPGAQLGAGDPGYTLEAEILYPKHYHKYGALAAARTGDQVNPERRSSGSQFYIVTGNKYTENQLTQMEHKMAMDAQTRAWYKLNKENADKIKELRQSGDKELLEAFRQELIKKLESEFKSPGLPADLKKDYIEKGGTPHLDNQYTVFGEVTEGMETVEKIQESATDANDRPEKDIKIISAKILQERGEKGE